MTAASSDGRNHSSAMRITGVNDESGMQASYECQVGIGVVLGAWRYQVVGMYTPVA